MKNIKKTNPLFYFILLIVSLLLIIITGPIGIIYSIFYHLINKFFFKKIHIYFLEIAIGIDQLGNIIMQHLFNHLLIKKNGYKFGLKYETISNVLGKNELQKTLSYWGILLNNLLNKMDSNHSLNSVKYYIEIKG